jgi:hypothetical protein
MTLICFSHLTLRAPMYLIRRKEISNQAWQALKESCFHFKTYCNQLKKRTNKKNWHWQRNRQMSLSNVLFSVFFGFLGFFWKTATVLAMKQ